MDKLEQMIEVNVVAFTRLAAAAAKAFVQRGRGTIINIASAVALAPDMLNGAYNGSKAYVLNFTQSMQNELAGKGVQIQAVLPGAVGTEFWARGGLPVEHLPKEIVMSVDAAVDAALAGLDQGELVTIPSLPDIENWDAFVAARKVLRPNLSRAQPAARYSPRKAASPAGHRQVRRGARGGAPSVRLRPSGPPAWARGQLAAPVPMC